MYVKRWSDNDTHFSALNQLSNSQMQHLKLSMSNVLLGLILDTRIFAEINHLHLIGVGHYRLLTQADTSHTNLKGDRKAYPVQLLQSLGRAPCNSC